MYGPDWAFLLVGSCSYGVPLLWTALLLVLTLRLLYPLAAAGRLRRSLGTLPPAERERVLIPLTCNGSPEVRRLAVRLLRQTGAGTPDYQDSYGPLRKGISRVGRTTRVLVAIVFTATVTTVVAFLTCDPGSPLYPGTRYWGACPVSQTWQEFGSWIAGAGLVVLALVIPIRMVYPLLRSGEILQEMAGLPLEERAKVLAPLTHDPCPATRRLAMWFLSDAQSGLSREMIPAEAPHQYGGEVVPIEPGE